MRALLMFCLALAACAETPKQEAAGAAEADRTRADIDRELAGRVPGPAKSCLQSWERDQVKAFGDTLVYRGRSGRNATRFVTQTTGCRGVGEDNILITRTPTTQLCRGDIATTVDRTSQFQTGGCSFGDFVPYSRPK